MTLIKDLIDIPDRVQKGDFVLRLSEDIEHPDVVLANYVVTPELAKDFDAALTFIRSAIQGRTSKATYLHGSFGSGKSHFMAVLHLILQGNPAARAIPELAWVIQKHNDWLAGKKFLLVPYHMINAHDMESGILGGYVDFIRRKHAGQADPAGLHVGGDHQPGGGRAGQLRRRGVFQAAQRRPGRRTAAGASWRRPGTRRRSRQPPRRRRIRSPTCAW